VDVARSTEGSDLVRVNDAVFALSPADAARSDERWSGVAEFLLVGGATLVLLPLLWLLRAGVGFDRADLVAGFLTFYGAYVINDPHFAVTYLLFYKDAKRRASSSELSVAYRVRYWVAGLVVPVGLGAWAFGALATRSAQMLGSMIQLMFLLVGWHYVKQGFGVLMVLSARRQVRWSLGERRVILAHCFAAWAYAWANPAMPAGEFEEKGVVYRALAHPRWFELTALALLAVSTLALLWILAGKVRRERRPLPFGPLAVFLISVWAWTIYSSADPLLRYVIPALHSVQYLYFVRLLKGNEAKAAEGPPFFGRPVSVRLGALALSALALGWFLFHGAPSILDPLLVPRRHGGTLDALGATPVFATLFVVVSIHHYFMDAVIWRRDHPDTRYFRITPSPASGPSLPSG
jgi:hypothetical protein